MYACTVRILFTFEGWKGETLVDSLGEVTDASSVSLQLLANAPGPLMYRRVELACNDIKIVLSLVATLWLQVVTPTKGGTTQLFPHPGEFDAAKHRSIVREYESTMPKCKISEKKSRRNVLLVQ